MTHTVMGTKHTPSTLLAAGIIFGGVAFGLIAANAFALMILLGIIWHETGWLGPVGFWPSVALVVLFGMLRGILGIKVSS